MSLATLPVEILYRILNHLDIHSIFVSLRYVCKRFNMITNTYNQYELDLSSISQVDIKLFARLIQPENVISISLTDRSPIENDIDLFFRFFDTNRFHKVRSLTLNKTTDKNLDHIFKSFCFLSFSFVFSTFE
jgi:hypothetical protein